MIPQNTGITLEEEPVAYQPEKQQHSIAEDASTNWGKRLLNRLSIRQKIGTGYALAVGIAILGTVVGLAVGDRYQNQAQKQLASAIEQEQLLNEMQRNVLHMRLHQHELVVLMKQPKLFQEKHHHFLTHIDKIRKVRPQLGSLAETTHLENLKGFLQNSKGTTETYSQHMEVLMNRVSPVNEPNLKAAEIESRQAQLLDFARSELALKFDGLLNELIDLIKDAQTSQDRAELEFGKAQALRTQIVAFCMALSGLIAVALALYTSRAIARPIEAATKVAQRVTKEENFALSAPVTSKDEVGVLATSLNQLIQWASEYTRELELARQNLEKRVEERTHELWEKNKELEVEREKSERLLLNILPEPIAHRLKHETSNIADSFAEVTVLFADIVDFTKLSSQISPTELVSLLNSIFCKFDELAEKHDLEKIKTIGDAYMVVGGIPTPRADSAEAIVEMALDMQQAIAEFNAENNSTFQMRMGINTGPVVAGVIGTKKFIYDLWGDTVNIASRMESHGVIGGVQVTATTYELLRDKYLFEERGLVHVKGKGDMTTYLLAGKKECAMLAV